MNRPAFKIVVALLVLAAGALGWSQVARAHRGSSATAPVRQHTVLKVAGDAGFRRRGYRQYYLFQVQGDGVLTIHATVRLKSRIALSGTLKRTSPRWETFLWKPKAIKKSFPAGTYKYCLVATDGAGHRARSCDSVIVL